MTSCRHHTLRLLALVAVGFAAIVFHTGQNTGVREAQGSSEFKGASVPFKPVTFCSSPLPQNSSSSSSQSTRAAYSHSTKKSVCQKIGDGRTSASKWRAHLHGILEASIHPFDEGRIHQNWTKELLDLVTPELMERALRTQPSYKDINRIIRIVDKRLHNSSAPPLHVGVFGGSVTVGSGCEILPKELKKKVKEHPGEKGGPVKGRICAWPFRLQQLADSFLGKGVVEIHNLAVGGTNSRQAQPVISYWLYPLNSPLRDQGPDVIVNSYSTNDNLYFSNATADFKHFNNTLKMTHSFVQTALRSRPCHDPPVVYFVDEYIGNQHELLLGEQIRHESVQLLSNQAGFGYISSAFAARPLVYADTSETLFSALWDKRGKRQLDVHFGMPGHVYVSWVFAYSVLKAAADFCVDQKFHDEDLRSSSLLKGSQTLVQSDFSPELTSGLRLRNATSQWNERETGGVRAEDEMCRSSIWNKTPCQFAFVATPAGTAHNAGQLNRYIAPFQVSSTGWAGKNDIKIGGWQNKLGLVADKAGASIVLELKNIENSIRFLTLDSLKSYGEKWANSEAQFNITIWNNSSSVEHETSFQVKGYHNRTASISSSYRLDLGAHSAKPGQTVTLEIKLVGGTMFKIIALMLCNR
jgi:hypothetical protein